jgi:phosphoglycerate dehydrogenase-like enzyme
MTHKPKSLIVGHRKDRTAVFPENNLHALNRQIDWISTPVDSREFQARLSQFRDLEIIFGTWGMPWLEQDLLESLPNLRAIFYAAGTLRSFVPDEFWGRDIIISTASKANAIPVADLTMAALVFGLKGILPAARETRRLRSYHPKPGRHGFGTYRPRIGLVSYGAIARLVRQRLRSLDAEVLVYDPFLSIDEADREDIALVELDEMFTQCHAVSVHAPALPSTRHLIRGHHIRALRENSVFINTARGSVVAQTEMISALQERQDIEAFIDVTDPEPPEDSSPLYDLPNVLLTPHIAGSTGHEVARLGQFMIEEYQRYASGQTLHHQVHRQDLELLA